MNALFALILATFLFLGGGATIAAAQDDLPNQPLYQLKLWTEDATLALTGDPQEQASLLINLAQTRVEEMSALAEMGITPPAQVNERLEGHLNQALVLAADMDEAAREQVLLQLQEHLQKQANLIEQLQIHTGANSQPLLAQTRQTLQTNLQLVDEGLSDPKTFRDKVKYRGQDKQGKPDPNQPGESGNPHNGPNGQPDGERGNGNDSPGNPNPDRPGNGNGGNESPGGQEPNRPNNGNCSGNNCDGGNGGGGNK